MIFRKFLSEQIACSCLLQIAARITPTGEKPIATKPINEETAMKKQILVLMSVFTMFAAKDVSAASQKGSASEIPAFYDHTLFTIHFVQFSGTAAQSLLQHNKSINLIYQSDPGLPGGAPFVSVIDAIPSDGF